MDDIAVYIPCESIDIIVSDDPFGPVVFDDVQIVRDTSDMDLYKGPVDIVPTVDREILLDTEGKLVASDITVRRLPIERTSNTSGGTTVWIGGIIDG